MVEYWERTAVSGVDVQKIEHRETVLHRRGEDPMVMACRRNRGLAGCDRIRTATEEAFLMIRGEQEARRPERIPKGEVRYEEWDW